jgi:DNA polymerase-3 subunit epsilon
MKLFFFDLETTGTDFRKNGIHQIAGKIVINGKEKESFDFKVRPITGARMDPKALEIGGVTEAQIMEYEPMESVYAKIITMLGKYVDKFKKTDKFFTVGFNNSHFDNPFFRAWFVQNNDKYFGSWFWSDTHDVMVLASKQFALKRGTMKDFKLKTVASTMGIKVDEDKLHDGSYDIDLTEQIYNKLNFDQGLVWEEFQDRLEMQSTLNKQKSSWPRVESVLSKQAVDAILSQQEN